MSKTEKEKLKEILYTLNIGTPMFWDFLEGKIKSYKLQVNELPWGTFAMTNSENILTDIRVLVPVIVDEKTLLVNIHEFAHAWELYESLGENYEEHKEESEIYAISKEQEYLKLTRKKGENNDRRFNK